MNKYYTLSIVVGIIVLGLGIWYGYTHTPTLTPEPPLYQGKMSPEDEASMQDARPYLEMLLDVDSMRQMIAQLAEDIGIYSPVPKSVLNIPPFAILG